MDKVDNGDVPFLSRFTKNRTHGDVPYLTYFKNNLP